MKISETYASIEDRDERANRLNKLLLKLANNEKDKTLRVGIKDAIKLIRQRIGGFTIKEIKGHVTELLNDYYALETADLIELSGVHENQMNFVLQIMEEQKEQRKLLEKLLERK